MGGSDQVTELTSDGQSSTIGTGWKQPSAVAVSPSDPIDVYVADSGNNQIEEVTPSGVQTTIGSGFNSPQGVAVDASGNVYVADSGNNRVVKVAAEGPAGGGSSPSAISSTTAPAAAGASAAGAKVDCAPLKAAGAALSAVSVAILNYVNLVAAQAGKVLPCRGEVIQDADGPEGRRRWGQCDESVLRCLGIARDL